jgi:hypothetical protein
VRRALLRRAAGFAFGLAFVAVVVLFVVSAITGISPFGRPCGEVWI